jgi:hypothetical protein
MFGVLALVVVVTGLSTRRETLRNIRHLEATLEHGSAVDHRIVSDRCFLIQPVQSTDSHFYYFDVGDHGTVMVDGLDDLPRDFPTTDITFTSIRDSKGTELEIVVRCDGAKLKPFLVVSDEDVKDWPSHEALVPMAGSLEDRLSELNLSAPA